MEISKELIIKVMDIKYPFSDIQLNSNILSWWREDVFFEETMKINICEFIFKCKEWAISKNYSLMSRQAREYDLCSRLTYKQVGICNILINDSPDVSKNILIENTEIEAIIKACEWILEQQKCQN